MARNCKPANGILQSGDYIEAVNGKPLDTKEQLMEAVNQAGSNGTGSVNLTVRRKEQAIDMNVDTVAAQDGTYKLRWGSGRYPGNRNYDISGSQWQFWRSGPWHQ